MGVISILEFGIFLLWLWSSLNVYKFGALRGSLNFEIPVYSSVDIVPVSQIQSVHEVRDGIDGEYFIFGRGDVWTSWISLVSQGTACLSSLPDLPEAEPSATYLEFPSLSHWHLFLPLPHSHSSDNLILYCLWFSSIRQHFCSVGGPPSYFPMLLWIYFFLKAKFSLPFL